MSKLLVLNMHCWQSLLLRFVLHIRDIINFKLLSLRLTGVETLESVPQNFKRRFHFFNLVSEILVSEIFQNTGFNYWDYRTDLCTSLAKKLQKVLLHYGNLK